MKRSNVSRIIIASLTVLAVALVLPTVYGAQDLTVPVTIKNTTAQPVPVAPQGATTVSGNVGITGTPTVNVGTMPNVTVSGTPNVNIANSPTVNLASGATIGISGTPTVNVANFPATGSTVTVGNTTNAPVPVRDVDNRARNAFVDTTFPDASITFGASSERWVQFDAPPAGKRLVIEQVYIDVFTVPVAGEQVSAVVVTRVSKGASLAALKYGMVGTDAGPVVDGGGLHHFILSAQMRMYSDDVIVVWVDRTDTTDQIRATADVFISGYLVDKP